MRVAGKQRGAIRHELRPRRRAAEAVGVRQRPDVALGLGAHATEHDQAVGRTVIHRGVRESRGRWATARLQLDPRRCAAETIRLREHPDVIHRWETGVATGEDDHPIGCAVVHGVAVCSRAWRSAGRVQPRPGRRPAEAVGVREDPHVIDGAEEEAGRRIAAEDDHHVVGRIVDGAVARAGARAGADRVELDPRGRAAHAGRVDENPHVVETPIGAVGERAAEHDHAVVHFVEDGAVRTARDRRSGRGKLQPRGVPVRVRRRAHDGREDDQRAQDAEKGTRRAIGRRARDFEERGARSDVRSVRRSESPDGAGSITGSIKGAEDPRQRTDERARMRAPHLIRPPRPPAPVVSIRTQSDRSWIAGARSRRRARSIADVSCLVNANFANKSGRRAPLALGPADG